MTDIQIHVPPIMGGGSALGLAERYSVNTLALVSISDKPLINRLTKCTLGNLVNHQEYVYPGRRLRNALEIHPLF